MLEEIKGDNVSIFDKIKKGWEDKIEKPFERDVIKPFERKIIRPFDDKVIGGFETKIIGGFKREIIKPSEEFFRNPGQNIQDIAKNAFDAVSSKVVSSVLKKAIQATLDVATLGPTKVGFEFELLVKIAFEFEVQPVIELLKGFVKHPPYDNASIKNLVIACAPASVTCGISGELSLGINIAASGYGTWERDSFIKNFNQIIAKYS